MVRTVEKPSVAVGAHKAPDGPSISVQRTEATSELVSDKAQIKRPSSVLARGGDTCPENGGTGKLKVLKRVYSPSKET